MMKNIRKFIYLFCILTLALIITSCSLFTSKEQAVDVDIVDEDVVDEDNVDIDNKDKTEKIIEDTTLEMEEFLSLLVETYESLGCCYVSLVCHFKRL